MSTKKCNNLYCPKKNNLDFKGGKKVNTKSRKQAILKIEIDRDLYDKYKRIVKSKNQMLKGYNNDLFLNAVKDEIRKQKSA